MSTAQPVKTRRYPKRGSLREALYAFYRDNPGALLGRQEALQRFDCTDKTLDRVMQELRDDGTVVAVFGYMLTDASIPLPCRPALPPAKPKRQKKKAAKPAISAPRPAAAWPVRIPISVFQLAETL